MFETVFVQKVSHFLLHCSSHLWCCYHLFAFYLLSIYFYDKYTVSILIWKIFIMICFGCVGFYLFLTLFFFQTFGFFLFANISISFFCDLCATFRNFERCVLITRLLSKSFWDYVYLMKHRNLLISFLWHIAIFRQLKLKGKYQTYYYVHSFIYNLMNQHRVE